MGDILTTFGIDWRLLLIQAVNFGLLLFILHRLLYTRIMRMLDQRQKVVAKGVEDAREAGVKLKETDKRREELLTQATKDAEGIVDKGKRHADEQQYAIVGAAEERASRIVTEAEKRAEEERKQIIQKSSADIAKLAVLAAEKVLRGKAS